jgi:hypothetical protein
VVRQDPARAGVPAVYRRRHDRGPADRPKARAAAKRTVPETERLSPHGLRAEATLNAALDEQIMPHTRHKDPGSMRGYRRRTGGAAMPLGALGYDAAAADRSGCSRRMATAACVVRRVVYEFLSADWTPRQALSRLRRELAGTRPHDRPRYGEADGLGDA